MKVYIEAGANDGIFQSRSLKHIDDNEYFGILIEALPDIAEQCKKNRSSERCKVINAALVPFSHNESNIEINTSKTHSAMNTVLSLSKSEYTNKVTVNAMTLTQILDLCEIDVVDIFYLDVEGYELEVLNGIDFSRKIIKQLELEVHYNLKGMNVNKEDEMEKHLSYLNSLGYHCDILKELGQHDKIMGVIK